MIKDPSDEMAKDQKYSGTWLPSFSNSFLRTIKEKTNAQVNLVMNIQSHFALTIGLPHKQIHRRVIGTKAIVHFTT